MIIAGKESCQVLLRLKQPLNSSASLTLKLEQGAKKPHHVVFFTTSFR